MKITKFFCDHCGKEVQERELLHISFGGLKVDTVEADLCDACVQEISRYIKNGEAGK